MMSTPKPRILLVVPDLTRQRLVRTALSRCGAFVSTEESGDAALRRCAVAPPAAVIVAVVLPGLSGLQVLARLRTDHPTLPVYLMDDDSAGGRMGAEGLAAGAAGVVQSAQVDAWANQIVQDLASTTAAGPAPAWLADPLPGPSAYRVEEHRAADGLAVYPDRDGLLWVNADHSLSQSLQPLAESEAPGASAVTDDIERMAKRAARPGREAAPRRGPAAPMEGRPPVQTNRDQREAPLCSAPPPSEAYLLPVLTALLERQLPVILADLLARERTKTQGMGRLPPDLMPALRSINAGFRTQMTRQITWSLQQIARSLSDLAGTARLQ
jgi:CheY-like chemotaxis protein